MDNINCVLCGGSPEIELPRLFINDKDRLIDICICNEIRYLVDNGVITYGCCCGHGKLKPSCLVDIKSENILNKLGYELHEYTERHSRGGHYEIYLKTDIQKEMRIVLESKVWKYKKENNLE